MSQQVSTWSSLLLYAALLAVSVLHSVSCAAVPGFHECILNSQQYAVGETFHPMVTINGVEYEAVCYQCTCQPTLIAQCEEIQCPAVSCPNPVRVDGQCCAVCIEPDITPGPQSCIFDGLRFDDGEVFHPPSAVRAYEDDFGSSNMEVENPYCTECHCNNGVVICQDISDQCPALTCDESEAVLPQGACCKECQSLPTTLRPGCYDFDGRFFEEGGMWHPTLPGYGMVPCITCTCENSKSICNKDPCPEVPTCGPDDPVEDIVICCPKCKRVTTTPPPTVQTEPTTESTTPTTTPHTDLSPELTPCQSPYTYRIHKSIDSDCMAMENTVEHIVELYKWIETLDNPGGITREYREVSSEEFNQLEEYDDFFFVGWTLPRRVTGLKTRQQKRKKIEACTVECSQLVVNMLRVVPTSETLQCAK